MLGQCGVHRRDGLAEPVRLTGEVTAYLVGVEVTFCEQVAGARGGHVPALGRVGGELGHHPQRARFTVHGRRLERPEQPGHVRIARAAEHPVQLDVGVDAGIDPSEDLEDGLFFEDHAGVALLGTQHPRRHAERQRDARLLGEDARRRPTADVSISDSRYSAGRRVVERVVAGAVLVGADRRDRAVLVDRACATSPGSRSRSTITW